jgi:hypothetical protein
LCGVLDRAAAQQHGFFIDDEGEDYIDLAFKKNPHPGQRFGTGYRELDKKAVN